MSARLLSSKVGKQIENVVDKHSVFRLFQTQWMSYTSQSKIKEHKSPSSDLIQDNSEHFQTSTEHPTLQDFCETEVTKEDSAELLQKEEKGKGPPVPPDPETCCESGCVNCVWIKYANEVNEYYPLEERQAKLKEILDQIEDYNVKMFLQMEIG